MSFHVSRYIPEEALKEYKYNPTEGHYYETIKHEVKYDAFTLAEKKLFDGLLKYTFRYGPCDWDPKYNYHETIHDIILWAKKKKKLNQDAFHVFMHWSECTA